MKKVLVLVLICFCTVILGGCSLTGLDAQGLMAPPRANIDQQEIHALLKSEDEQMNFVYPKSGEFRSAVIMRDFTGDGIQDAVGFCADLEGGISLRFMTKNEGKWRIMNSLKNTASQVDRVQFGDLNGDGKEEVVVGWGAPQSMTAVACVYSYKDGEIKEYQLEHPYNDFLLTDFDGDGAKELFAATVFVAAEEAGGENRSAMGRVYAFMDGLKLSYSVSLSDTVVRYSTSTFAALDENQKGVVLEGVVADGGAITQVLYLDGDRLLSPLAGKGLLREYNYFSRAAAFTLQSRDVDGDGIIEFPRLRLQPGYSAETPQEPYAYYVDWVKLDMDSYTREDVQRSIMNFGENFYLTVPEDRIIVCKSQGKREYLFEEVMYGFSGKELYRKKLFSVKVFTTELWQSAESKEGYGLLFTTQSNLVYGVKHHLKEPDETIIKGIKPIIE